MYYCLESFSKKFNNLYITKSLMWMVGLGNALTLWIFKNKLINHKLISQCLNVNKHLTIYQKIIIYLKFNL